jgi:putative transposase
VLLRLSYLALTNVFTVLRLLPMSDTDKDIEILTLRYQLGILQRQARPAGKPRLTWVDRALLAALLHRLSRPRLSRLQLIVSPDTILRWHRDFIRRRHAARSKTSRQAADPPRHPVPRPAPGAGEPQLGLPSRPR